MARTFTLDTAGIAEILKGEEVRKAVNDAAEQVAREVESALPAGTSVTVEHYTTDRDAASVTIEGDDGGQQAKNGVFSRAAAAAGLGFTSRPGTAGR